MSTFRLQVLSILGTLIDQEVESVYLTGDQGEYELLPFHFPLMGAIPEGEVKIAGHPSIKLRAGVVLFENNKCTMVIEELDTEKRMKVQKVGKKA